MAFAHRLADGSVATLPVEAITMTPTEIEVWQTVVALNRAWTSGHPEQLADYFHEEIVAITPTDRHRLEGRDACIAGWTAFVEKPSFHATSFFEFDEHGQIVAITECWATDEEPPEWRTKGGWEKRGFRR